MKRVVIAELKQETSTFNPARTLYESFHIHRGEEILSAYRGTKTELAGAIDVFESEQVEIVPAMAAASVSGGPIRTADLDRLLDEVAASIRECRDVDGCYLCLHGAMAGEDEGDPEGRLLSKVRALLGALPLVASLDLHAVLSDRMVKAADVLVPFHTYPHVDQYETGARAARVLMKLLEGSVEPAVARVELPMLVRGDELITATGLFGQAIRMCQEIETSPSGLAAGVLIGNAFTDVPDLKSNVLIATDGDRQRAEATAEEIARFMWQHRASFQAQLTSLSDALRQAEETAGLTIFSDAADATASGASGDSNAILKGLIEASFAGASLVPIVDAPAVEKAFAAGVGATVALKLGGTIDPGRFSPLPVSARVKSLHDGNFHYENGAAEQAGRVAVLVVGRVHVMVVERSIYFVGRKVFESHGLDPRDYDVVVVKSPNGFRTYYEPIAGRIVPVDVPGSTSANLRSLPFQNCPRPMFPLDEDAEFELPRAGR